MKRILLSLFLLSAISLAVFAGRAQSASDPLVEATRKIAAEITDNGKAYADLRELTTIGPRLSGSEGAAKAVAWAKRKMESYGFDRVILQPTMVPHWTRGDVERATVTSTPQPISLKVAALGNSVGTPRDGVEAGVVEVAVCLMTLRGQWLPPEVSLQTPDPLCKFPVVQKPATAKLEYALTNSFGFGGANATVILRKF